MTSLVFCFFLCIDYFLLGTLSLSPYCSFCFIGARSFSFFLFFSIMGMYSVPFWNSLSFSFFCTDCFTCECVCVCMSYCQAILKFIIQALLPCTWHHLYQCIQLKHLIWKKFFEISHGYQFISI